MQTQDGIEIVTKQKSDRAPIWQVFVGPTPRCQIRKDLVADDGAYQVMLKVCKLLAAGEIGEMDLYALRDQLLQDLGMPAPGRSAKKKPAATQAASAAQPGGSASMQAAAEQPVGGSASMHAAAEQPAVSTGCLGMPPMFPDLF